MTNPLTTDHARNLALLLARVGLGTYFMLAGYNKFAGGVGNFVSKNISSVPDFMSEQLGRYYLYALPSVEMIVGVALIIGLYTRTAATLMFLMLVSFMIAATGFGFTAESKMLPDKNVIFAGLAFLLMTTGGGKMAVDSTFGGASPGPAKK